MEKEIRVEIGIDIRVVLKIDMNQILDNNIYKIKQIKLYLKLTNMKVKVLVHDFNGVVYNFKIPTNNSENDNVKKQKQVVNHYSEKEVDDIVSEIDFIDI